jgi:hypothetical protein
VGGDGREGRRGEVRCGIDHTAEAVGRWIMVRALYSVRTISETVSSETTERRTESTESSNQSLVDEGRPTRVGNDSGLRRFHVVIYMSCQ